MTKVEAIKKVMEDNGGTATWEIIYRNIEKYYPAYRKQSKYAREAGLRGVLYREIKNNRNFKKIGLGIFALLDYEEKEKINKKDIVRMHSYIEGICIELGNLEKFDTYTADPGALFKSNIFLKDLSSLKYFPKFTYNEIIEIVKEIDVVWFNKNGFKFPKRTFEIVHSIGTLGDALSRSFQLAEFQLDFYIVGKEKHREKFYKTITREPYMRIKDRFIYRSYDEITEFYEKKLELEKIAF